MSIFGFAGKLTVQWKIIKCIVKSSVNVINQTSHPKYKATDIS